MSGASEKSQFEEPFVLGKYLTLTLFTLILKGVICEPQSVPVYPSGQSHPQSEFETPPLRQGIGVQEESESEEQPLKAKNRIVTSAVLSKNFFINCFNFPRPKGFKS